MYKRYKDVSLILKIVIGIVVGAVLGIGASWSFYRCFRQAVCWRVEGNRTVTCFPVDYVRNFQISLRVEKPFWHCH